jgi:hypothetical protein
MTTALKVQNTTTNEIVNDLSLGGGIGRRTGLKILVIRLFNDIRNLPKSTENIIQTHDWRGFLAVIRSEVGVKLPKIHRRQIGDMKSPANRHIFKNREMFFRQKIPGNMLVHFEARDLCGIRSEGAMVYFGHFSIWSDGNTSRRGYFTCVAEAESIGAALEKFRRLLRRHAGIGAIFSGVAEVDLDTCIESRLIPKRGFLAYYCEELSERPGTISVSLPGVGAKHAMAYGTSRTQSENDQGVSEPFLVLKRE